MISLLIRYWGGAGLCIFITAAAAAQQPDAATGAATPPPEISAEPQTVDPAQFVAAALAAPASVQFTNSSLRELVAWLQDERKLPVLIDQRALADEGVSLGEPVSDQLSDAPIYLLLNRLRGMGLAWYMEDDLLHITTQTVAEQRMTTQPYNIGDLFDQGYKPEALVDVVLAALGAATFLDSGGSGDIQALGDVLFVRQTDQRHRELQGLLTALRKHGRQTLILDPPQHVQLREKLSQPVTVDFADTPLETAIQSLAQQAQADIRLDAPALRASRIREREPVTLRLSERSLQTVLQVLLADLNLTWVLEDGALWITSQERAASLLKSAVYDVRDLCRNAAESAALKEAIENQTTGPWEDVAGEGGVISFPQPGAMVVRQTERGLAEVLALLETYRTALKSSKPRDRGADARAEVVTRYYRMDAAMAADLLTVLPQLVQPETWRQAGQSEAPGTILRIASPPEHQNEIVLERAVLVIRQTVATHEAIAAVVQKVQTGDAFIGLGQGKGGQGGFGGGMFATPPASIGTEKQTVNPRSAARR